jgi:ABC-type phosphate transport system substrate-binding protein
MRTITACIAILLLCSYVSGDGPTSAPSHPAALTARTAAGFRPRAGVEHLIEAKRSKDEDSLRAALLACAQSDEELKTLAAMVNGRWDKKNIGTLGDWLVEDWDKAYGASLRRPKSIFELLVYVRNHEKPYAFKDGGDVGVTVAEARRMKDHAVRIDMTIAGYYEKLFNSKSNWPADSRSELLYHITATLEEHGAPEMITEAVWKGMVQDKNCRWDMLGVITVLANQAILERLLKFRDSQQWAKDDLDRIDKGIEDVKWWLRRAENMAKTRPPDPEAKVIVSEEETKLMLKRVADARAGRCPTIKVVGDASARTSLDALSLTYTKLNVPVRPMLSDAGEVASLGAFVSGYADVVLLADKPSARAMQLHGQKWNALGRDKDGKPNGTGPAEYLLAGRAAAVIVNPANKIDALTIGQLQAIFGGEVADWGTIGSTGLTTRGNSGSQIKGSQIKIYGLRADDPATGIFEKECLDRYKWRRVVVKKDTAEAVAAVSMDPQAIGFVDLAAIPATGQSVRILGIRLPGRGSAAAPPPAFAEATAGRPPAGAAGTSPVRGGGVAAPPPAPGATSPRGGGVYYPSPENIKSAMYPLSQRLWLYVHPKASDTAKDFVKFIATCGASEASPYADTVKAVMDTYRKHGLVPLADAALERMAKDAMADAAAKAKAKADKPKGRGKK